jgi:HrpA-like RNA helicase
LGAIGINKFEECTENEDKTNITELGRVLAAIPILPKFGKLLLEAR